MSRRTPLPYVVDRSLDLTITRTFSDQICNGQLPVIIAKTFRITQSPVMVVTFITKSGPMNAVLKLYDRRFGPDFRTIEGTYSPHTSEDEATWQEYVHKGMAAPFFHRMEEDQAASLLPLGPDDYYEDSWKGRAQYEAGLQRRVLQYFDMETEAYERLIDLQGTYIPMMLAHVCVSQPMPDLAEQEVYFRIPGILIQLIDGCSLWHLVDRQKAPKKEELRAIVQKAVDIADAINDRGVVMGDCRPQNVVVERETRQPFICDFAQCGFKETCAYDPDDPDDQGYQDAVYQNGNPKAIGMVMATRVKRELGFQLNIQYRNLEPSDQ